MSVEGQPTRAEVRRLREGVELEDGMTAPAKASLLAEQLLKITIHEGRNRQIRRMCEAIGHPVLRLVRTRIGPITDRSLKAGEWRELTPDEVRALERAASGQSPPAGRAAWCWVASIPPCPTPSGPCVAPPPSTWTRRSRSHADRRELVA